MFKLRSNLTTDGISHNILPVSVYAKLFPPIFSSSGYVVLTIKSGISNATKLWFKQIQNTVVSKLAGCKCTHLL